MRSKLKKLIGVISFIIVFGLVFYTVDTTLKFKYADGILPIEDLYQYPENSVDVLLLGSSHVGVNIDTIRLNEDYGMAAYNLWGSVQPTWNSYYYLKEALKTQKPKVIVLEGFLASQDYDYMDYSRVIKNTLGMKWSWNKVEAINVSADIDVKKDVLLGFSTYHTRYASLEPEDFSRYAWDFQLSEKGVSNGSGIAPCKEPETVPYDDYSPLNPKMEEYLVKIMELCRSRNIPLVLFVSPFSASRVEMERFNTVRKLAEEYQVDFINYNLDYKEIGIDYTKDYADAAGHLNDGGVKKLTEALGSHLLTHYDLPKRYKDKWFSRKTPEDAAYMLDSEFKGDGTSLFIDTGQKLYYDPKQSWTILTKIDNRCESTDKVYFSCFNEAEPYGGLLVRQMDGKLQIIIGNNYYVETQIPESKTSTLAILNQSGSYTVYLDGKILQANINSAYDSYSGTLLLGCENTPDLKKMRYSAVTLEQFIIYDRVMDNGEILDWMSKNITVLTKEESEELLREQYTGKLDYSLAKIFTGDGESSYVDTGMQLYYEPERDWTLLAELDTLAPNANGVYFSCFAEEEGKYRGLLVRKDDKQLHVIVGNNFYVELLVPEDKSTKIAITKSGDTYNIWLNGIKIAQDIVNPCEAYIGSLLIGCQDSMDYEKFRFSQVTVNQMEVHEGVLSDKEIQGW